MDAIRRALETDRTIDIVTTGARSGKRRVTEIWFTNIAGRIIICGTPGKRHWLANLKADNAFEFRLKESVAATLPARARLVRDPADRRAIMSAAETEWYRQQGYLPDELTAGAPIVEVTFTAPFDHLNQRPAPV